MMDINGKVSYLRGLADGIKLDEDTDEGKLLLTMIDVLTEMAVELQAIDLRFESMGEDICELENEVFMDDLSSDAFDDGLYEVECDNCKNVILVDEDDILSNEPIKCLHCDEVIPIDFPSCSCDCDDDSCGCKPEEVKEKSEEEKKDNK